MRPGRDEERLALSQQAAKVLAYLRRRTSSDERALSLFRQTMIRAWGRIDRFPAADHRRQQIWLLGVAAKVLAGSGSEPDAENSADAGSGRPHARGPQLGGFSGEALRLREALPRLRHVQRELVTLVHWDGLTLGEAAEVLGVRMGSAVGSTARPARTCARCSRGPGSRTTARDVGLA